MPAMLQNSGITITPDMVKVPFRLIDRPKVLYRQGAVTFEAKKAAAWKTANQKFVATKNEIASGIVFAYDGDVSSGDFQRYINEFLGTFALNGIKHRKDPLKAKVPFTQLTKYAAQADLSVLVVQGTSTRKPYADFRSEMDQTFVKASLVLNADRMKPMGNLIPYMASNALKINVRLGNENHYVENGFNHMKASSGKCDTLVLGADLIHPKQSSVGHTPSIATLVGSVDGNFATFYGSARYQDAGNEYIEYNQMLSMAKECIKAWCCKSGGNPRILYYRDGTGKTQFDEVRSKEIAAIKTAWGSVTEINPSKLKITTVIVVKRHSTRFYPLPDDEKHTTDTGNCKPGTVVDSVITDPSYNRDQGQFHFYLQSHDVEPKDNKKSGKAENKGVSAKPTHYHVRENLMNLSKKDLQQLTYHFCYNFSHTTNAVSYASPAYYADRLCERVS